MMGGYALFYGWYLAGGGPVAFATLLPVRAWGWVWLGTGMAMLAGATRDRDAWFFALAAGVQTAWALEFFRAWLHGYQLEWARGCYFLALAAVIMLAASWPEDGSRQP